MEPSALAWWTAHCWSWTRGIVLIALRAAVASLRRTARRLSSFLLLAVGTIALSVAGSALGTLLPWP